MPKAGAKYFKYDFDRFLFLSLNRTIAKAILCDIDLHF